MELEVYKCFWYGVCYACPITFIFGLFYGLKRAFTASARFNEDD